MNLDQFDPFKNPPRQAGMSVVAPGAMAPPAPNPSVQIGAGFTPNYKDLILGDPSYLAWKNNSQLDLSQAASARGAALKSLATRYGGLPTGFKDTYGDIDPNTLDLAGRNQFSDVNKVRKNYEDGVQALKRQLAGRGALQSGDLGYGMDQAEYSRGAAESAMGQDFLNTAQEAINNYIGAESGVRRGEAGALSQAQSNIFANPAYRPTEGSFASIVPDWEAKYGEPVYQGPDGKLYRPDGSPFTVRPSVAPQQGGFGTGTRLMQTM